MNVLKEVLKNQVYPAMGCTEPVSVALCGAYAAELLAQPVQKALFRLDPGTYKNGCGVRIPHTEGEKGNLLAAALGVLIAKPQLQMEILSEADAALLARAKEMVSRKQVRLEVAPEKHGFYIETRLQGAAGAEVQCIIAGSHTDVVFLAKDGKIIKDLRTEKEQGSSSAAFK